MLLTLKEVEHIAALARLELNSEEKEKYRIQLSAILDHIQQLSHVDTSQLIPNDASKRDSRLRDDVAVQSLPTADVLNNVKHKQNKQFRVPGIFKEPGA